ncbi:MAG: molybdenum cofactor sulfurase [Ahrensia sp.]|nr:molybdenum cofactor sulfurase [Ahrensia sp.]
MIDPFQRREELPDIFPAQKLTGTIKGLYRAEGDNFVTMPIETLDVTFEGIPGDVHAGTTRRSGGREPWYPRGTPMRNERQISILSPKELAVIANRLDIRELKPEWIGGNLLLDGIDAMTMLPPRTLLFFENGVTIKIDGDNAPCRLSGRSIADHVGNRPDIEIAFPQQAQHLRGLVGWVEKEGSIAVGERFEARIPPQWIYRSDKS